MEDASLSASFHRNDDGAVIISFADGSTSSPLHTQLQAGMAVAEGLAAGKLSQTEVFLLENKIGKFFPLPNSAEELDEIEHDLGITQAVRILKRLIGQENRRRMFSHNLCITNN